MKCVSAILVLVLLTCCENTTRSIEFPFILDEPCIIWNYEQDNTIEGTYFEVTEINGDSLTVSLPNNFFITSENWQKWMLGFGDDKRHRDNGVQNLFKIIAVDSDNNKLVLGNRIRGKKALTVGENIVFWNRNPSGYRTVKGRLLDLNSWPLFSGESVHMGFVAYDSLTQQYIMYFNEVDCNQVQIYVAGARTF